MFQPFLRLLDPPVVRVVRIHHSGARFIVAAMHQVPGGIYYEQRTPVVVEVHQPATLGAAFQTAFDAFSVRDMDMSSMKKTDWPRLTSRPGCDLWRCSSASTRPSVARG